MVQIPIARGPRPLRYQIPIARGPRPLRYQRRHLLKTYAFTELGGIIRTSTSDPGFCFGDALRWSVLPVPLHILNSSDASDSTASVG